MFLVVFRAPTSAAFNHAPFATLDDARRWGDASGRAYDVAFPSGAIAWVWEMR